MLSLVRNVAQLQWISSGWQAQVYRRFQGAQPDHVRIENSSCCFPDKVIAELQRPEGPPSGAP